MFMRLIQNIQDYSTGRYGKLPMNQSTERTETEYLKISSISAADEGKTVAIDPECILHDRRAASCASLSCASRTLRFRRLLLLMKTEF